MPEEWETPAETPRGVKHITHLKCLQCHKFVDIDGWREHLEMHAQPANLVQRFERLTALLGQAKRQGGAAS